MTRTFITALAALIAGSSVAFAETKIDHVTGCKIVKVEGANYYNYADPTCARSGGGNGAGGPGLALALAIASGKFDLDNVKDKIK
jgi:hypothetical protein